MERQLSSHKRVETKEGGQDSGGWKWSGGIRSQPQDARQCEVPRTREILPHETQKKARLVDGDGGGQGQRVEIWLVTWLAAARTRSHELAGGGWRPGGAEGGGASVMAAGPGTTGGTVG
ncbi:hypothetical protein GUJ93_ZPchr0013g34646 [Zizania palustris]|uniref:Uncharacterized protein n=1 Tax=Zizania palustris TaxID=103762 RepID=A0A8J6BX46_ZIZPA|nr:hypothetical protein GUJ93_ZPchr0013g34646 [Zizania palustris]